PVARRLLGVVGDVPTGALELDRGRGEELLDGPPALRALLQGCVGELLDQLEAPVPIALVLVERHVAATSKRSNLARSTGGAKYDLSARRPRSRRGGRRPPAGRPGRGLPPSRGVRGRGPPPPPPPAPPAAARRGSGGSAGRAGAAGPARGGGRSSPF